MQSMPLQSAAGWRHAPANCLQASGTTHQQACSRQRYMHNHLCTPRDCMQHMCHPRGSIVPAGHYLEHLQPCSCGRVLSWKSVSGSIKLHACIDERQICCCCSASRQRRAWQRPPLVSDERRILRCGSEARQAQARPVSPAMTHERLRLASDGQTQRWMHSASLLEPGFKFRASPP